MIGRIYRALDLLIDGRNDAICGWLGSWEVDPNLVPQITVRPMETVVYLIDRNDREAPWGWVVIPEPVPEDILSTSFVRVTRLEAGSVPHAS